MAESHPKFDVSLVTPDGAAFDGEAEMVIVPGAASSGSRPPARSLPSPTPWT